MTRAIITNEKIEAFLKIAPTILMALTREADNDGTWFKAKCRVKYKQEFDIDSDKGLGGEAHATQPGVTILGAEAKAKVSVEKSREGVLLVDETFEFQSIKARLSPTPKDQPD